MILYDNQLFLLTKHINTAILNLALIKMDFLNKYSILTEILCKKTYIENYWYLLHLIRVKEDNTGDNVYCWINQEIKII